MNKESGLFEDIIVAKEDKNYYHDFNLLKTTASSRLWRVSRDGKYFLVKTTKDNSEFQTKMLRREYECLSVATIPISFMFLHTKTTYMKATES